MHPISSKLDQIVLQARLDNVDPMIVRMMLKETLQTHILFALYNSKLGERLIFYGGTALRKLYDLNRMSEDLDFETSGDIDINDLADTVAGYFKKQKYDEVEYKIQKGKKISRVTYKFPMLYELGLSSQRAEKLHIKVEINPQVQTDPLKTELSMLVEDQLSVMVRHYSLPVLMAGKIGACLDRVFKIGKSGITVKGRDYYDLIWYMRKRVEPDEEGLKRMGYTRKRAFLELDEKITKISAGDLLFDLQPFFQSRAFVKDWCDNFHRFYERYRGHYA